MADSDDEYDRKRRDKFRGERGAAEGSSYRSSDRREERSRGREEWSERSHLKHVEPSKFPTHIPKAIKRSSVAFIV
ncbi:jg23287, partial [Pararge aegeria aegeria]